MNPPEIRHKKWRHKLSKYIVEVLEVRNHNEPPFYKTVVVDRTQFAKKPKLWSVILFLKTFEPIGQPQPKKRTLWDHIGG